MTTLVGIRKDNEIILATDSRATGGTYIYQDQITKINNMGNWAIAFAGNSIFKEIIKINKHKILQEWPIISEDNAFLFIGYLTSLFLEYGIERIKRADEVWIFDFDAIIINNTGELFYINGNPSYIKMDSFICGGSGANYAEAVIKILINQDLTLEYIARQAIETASSFDAGTDNKINYITYRIDNESTT